jgi:hypothetical protein
MTRASSALNIIENHRVHFDDMEESEPDDSIDLFPIEIQLTSLKIGWTLWSASGEPELDCYLLQWRLHGSKQWTSLPATVSVPRVRLENLEMDRYYDFRVRCQSISNAAARSKFSRAFSFKTLDSESLSSRIITHDTDELPKYRSAERSKMSSTHDARFFVHCLIDVRFVGMPAFRCHRFSCLRSCTSR